MTRLLTETLASLDIYLIDHVVVAENECISLASVPETADLFATQ